MEIGIIFSAVGTAKSVAEMLGAIDSLEAKVDRLVRSELNAGFRNLDAACVAQSERDSLLREARGCFNKAVSLESGLRQGLALLGCAVCHHHLGDTANWRRCLDELVQLPPAVGWGTRITARLFKAPWMLMPDVSSSPEAHSLLTLQTAVAEFTGTPVPWVHSPCSRRRWKRQWEKKRRGEERPPAEDLQGS